ncbi:MAG: hypothetical protein ACLFQV_07175 [Vulcanimicrobiota bacterium]
MDIERLAQGICDKVGCEKEFTGDEENPEYKLVFDVDENRKQEVFVYPFEEDNKGFLRIFTYIGKKSDFTPNKLISLLDLNMSLRFGAFAVFQGQVVLQASAMYDSVVDEDKVVHKIKYIMKMADSLERSLFGLDRK